MSSTDTVLMEFSIPELTLLRSCVVFSLKSGANKDMCSSLVERIDNLLEPNEKLTPGFLTETQETRLFSNIDGFNKFCWHNGLEKLTADNCDKSCVLQFPAPSQRDKYHDIYLKAHWYTGILFVNLSDHNGTSVTFSPNKAQNNDLELEEKTGDPWNIISIVNIAWIRWPDDLSNQLRLFQKSR